MCQRSDLVPIALNAFIIHFEQLRWVKSVHEECLLVLVIESSPPSPNARIVRSVCQVLISIHTELKIRPHPWLSEHGSSRSNISNLSIFNRTFVTYYNIHPIFPPLTREPKSCVGYQKLMSQNTIWIIFHTFN